MRTIAALASYVPITAAVSALAKMNVYGLVLMMFVLFPFWWAAMAYAFDLSARLSEDRKHRNGR
jgi:hypothetical protein